MPRSKKDTKDQTHSRGGAEEKASLNPDKSGKVPSLSEIADEVLEPIITEKRSYRRAEDLPDKDKSHRAEVNRTANRLNPRISLDHVEAFNRAAKNFESPREALEYAMKLFADDQEIETDDLDL